MDDEENPGVDYGKKSGNQQLILENEEEFKMEGTEDYLAVRNSKIARVARTLGHVHKMYQNLNDIVD